ncbi:MAG: bifunctional lysylphosphatidylglycerol flippase/synthetase MprF [Amaricoccus sp.]
MLSGTDEDEAPGLAARAWSALRKQAPVIVTLALFLAGLYALHRLLAPLDFNEVAASIRSTPPQTYLKAMGATLLGYAALIGYDWTALQYIGKRLPLPSVALGSFLAYAFGNTIGLSALSGGAVRYRLYTALGLDGYDVAAISSYVAVAYGTGATMIGLGALALHPEAVAGITPMAPATLRLAAFGLLAVMAGTIAFLSLRGARFRLGRFEIRAPRFGHVLWQMLFSLIDVSMAALALYVLLPSGGPDYLTFVAVFAVATMAGVVSHVPGGIGVFESVIIAALGSSVPINDAVTGLLLFRLVYFLLPFVMALALLSLSEIWMATGRAGPVFLRLAPVLQAAQSIIPLAMGIVVLASGLFMMFAGLLRNPTFEADKLQRLLPLVLVEGGALLSSVLGSALVVLALGLFRRSRAAFWLVLATLALSIVAALLHGRDLERAAVLALLMLILWPCRREFYRAARLSQGVMSPQWILFTLAILVSIGTTYFIVHRSAPYAGAMWWQFGLAQEGPRALRAALTGSVFLTLALLLAAMQTRRRPLAALTPAALARAEAIVRAHGTASELRAVTGDKQLIFSENDEAVLSYAVRGASWIALGAPVGPEAARESLAWDFHDAARAAHARPVFYEAPDRFRRQSLEMGLALHRMGEEAVVPLRSVALVGPLHARRRAMHERGLKEGLSFELVQPPHPPALLATLESVSRGCLAARGGREKRFAVGFFDRDWLQRFPIALARRERAIVGFANLPVTDGRSVALDMLRVRPDAPPGTADFLLVAAMLHLAREGYRELSLGVAPPAKMGSRPADDPWARFAALILRRGDRGCDVESVRRAMARFDPEWQPRYLCCRSVLAPVAPLADVAMLIAGASR